MYLLDLNSVGVKMKTVTLMLLFISVFAGKTAITL